MPSGDQTGPMGQGSMSGRAMGYCAGFSVPGYMNSCFARGFGGRRFFRRTRFMPIQQIQPQVITEKQEKEYLNEELETLKQEMQDIQDRLKELKDK